MSTATQTADTAFDEPILFTDSAAAKVADLIAEEGNPDLKLLLWVGALPRAPLKKPQGRPAAPIKKPQDRPAAPIKKPQGRPAAPIKKPQDRPAVWGTA